MSKKQSQKQISAVMSTTAKSDKPSKEMRVAYEVIRSIPAPRWNKKKAELNHKMSITSLIELERPKDEENVIYFTKIKIPESFYDYLLNNEQGWAYTASSVRELVRENDEMRALINSLYDRGFP